MIWVKQSPDANNWTEPSPKSKGPNESTVWVLAAAVLLALGGYFTAYKVLAVRFFVNSGGGFLDSATVYEWPGGSPAEPQALFHFVFAPADLLFKYLEIGL